MSGIYDDYPGCLIRYAWLVEESNGRNLYTGADENARCKACGKLTKPGEQVAHRREHVRELARMRKQSAQQRRKDAARHLRTLNRLRQETR